MILESNNSISSLFDGEMISMSNSAAYFGMNPHHLTAIYQNSMNFMTNGSRNGDIYEGMSAWLRGLGAIYTTDGVEGDGIGSHEKINSVDFCWENITANIKNYVINSSDITTGDNPGADGSSFSLTLSANGRGINLAPGDILCTEEYGEQLEVLSIGQSYGSGYEVEFRIHGVGQTAIGVDEDSVRRGKTLRYLYRIDGEFARGGNYSSQFNSTKLWNRMNKQVKTFTMSTDMMAIYGNVDVNQNIKKTIKNGELSNVMITNPTTNTMVKEKDLAAYFHKYKGKGSTIPKNEKLQAHPFFMAEKMCVRDLLVSMQGSEAFGKTNINPKNGKVDRFEDNNTQMAYSGDGFITQYEKEARTERYPRGLFTARMMEEAIKHVAGQRNQTMGNHIICVCNRKFWFDSVHPALNSEAKNFTAPNGNWYVNALTTETAYKDMISNYKRTQKDKQSKTGNVLEVGATFQTYIFAGSSITFLPDSALSQQYQNTGYAIFIDNGLYTDVSGKEVAPIRLVTLKNKGFWVNYYAGAGMNGQAVLESETFKGKMGAFSGVAVMNPKAAMIFKEEN